MTTEGWAQQVRFRLRRTGQAGLAVALFGPTIAVFVVTVVGLATTPVTAGLLLVFAGVPLTAAVADVHRRMATEILGVSVERPYRRPDTGGQAARLRTWGRDRARWRDLLWCLCSMTAGFSLSILPVAFLLAAAWYLLFPLVWAVTPDGVFDQEYGVIFLDTQAETFLQWILVAVALVLWWWTTPGLTRTRAAMDAALLGPERTRALKQRVEVLAQTRAESVDHSAAELRRVERDLHDGAQARLVALGMNLGMAEEMLARDPAAARVMLAEARATTTSALSDLRSVVRGIHPPVLADRGLGGAVQALVLDLPLPVAVSVDLPGRPPAPVESAAYFAVVECLTNVVRHSGASSARVELSGRGDVLVAVVEDGGRGGASLERGTGLVGVARRLAAFDGTLSLSSPTGGPTVVRMELPCVWSSARTSPSSGTG